MKNPKFKYTNSKKTHKFQIAKMFKSPNVEVFQMKLVAREWNRLKKSTHPNIPSKFRFLYPFCDVFNRIPLYSKCSVVYLFAHPICSELNHQYFVEFPTKSQSPRCFGALYSNLLNNMYFKWIANWIKKTSEPNERHKLNEFDTKSAKTLK